MSKKTLTLNRAPYWGVVLEDHTGEKYVNIHFPFTEKWFGKEFVLDVVEEDDMFWRGKMETVYEGGPGWLLLELVKECFDVVEE